MQSKSVKIQWSVGDVVDCVAHLDCSVSDHLGGYLRDFAPGQKVFLPFGLLACVVNTSYLLVLDRRFVTEEADCDLIEAAGQRLGK